VLRPTGFTLGVVPSIIGVLLTKGIMMNYLDKMDKAIELMKEALVEAVQDRARLAGGILDTPLKSIFNVIKNSGIVEGRRYKSSEILMLINIADDELEAMAKYIPNFGGSREVRFGKLLSSLAKYNMDGYAIKEGSSGGCKTYRLERV